ncbi:hypothetical protein HF086_007097 [Spodoptera exigua]|uniref:RNA-directed DNA polymerase n=1 Tax=Spodoptera exigua TaxID=7107 RepID=A0A922MFB6_SPOEX|nr:hypothetical protein HF086_007097 [Spodoptera exigua]
MTSNNDNELINSDSTDKGTDQPRVVELTTIPKEGVELQFIKGNELNKVNINDKTNIKESKTLIYLKKEKTLYIKLVSPSQMTRRAFVRELGIKCKEWNINKITVRKNKNNNVFVKTLANEIQKTKEGSIPSLCIINDVIKITNKDEKKVILNDFHILPTSGHAGERKMYNNIKRRYFWSGLEEDIKNYVQKCEKCQKEKYSRYTKEPMTITTTATEAFQKIFMDVVGPLERDEENFSYILTIQCELTKYIEAYPMKTKSTKEVAEKFVNNFILRFGIPEIIATDRGTEFISTTFQEVCNLLHINKLTSTAYHHQSIGALENSHKSLGTYLRIQTDNHSGHWSKWIAYWCFAYNTSVHTETKFTPFELVFGKQANLPSNLTIHPEPIYNHESYPLELKYRLQLSQTEARENLIKSKMIRKIKYDKNCNPVVYKPNDKVLIKNENRNKLTSIYSGPYIVVREISPNVKI